MTNDTLLERNDLIAILDGMVEGIVTINDKGIILSFNKSAATIFGYTHKEMIGQNVRVLMPEPDKSSHDGYLKRYMTTDDAHIIGIGRDVTAIRKNGELFPLHLSINEYPSKVEGERWFVGSFLDTTLQKQQEEQLNRSIKMEAIGKLTGGISHDYNNMLGVILGYSELLMDELKEEPELLGYMEHIKHAAERGAELTGSLLTFSSKKEISKEDVNINEVLRTYFKMLEKTISTNIKLNMNLDDDLWPAYFNRGCLEDAILNISINATHAMPEGGTLNYKTSNIQIGILDSQILDIDKGDYIKFQISDTGIGMDKETSSKIFDPFFTTKGDKGTGLGLSQVYRFINNSNGAIRLYSEMGHGTTFTIYLPRHTEYKNDSDIKEEISLERDKQPITGNILVVDDEVSLRELNDKVLSSKGYTVFCAATGKQALSILEKENIDLMLSDVIMPEMDGYELAYTVQRKYPDIKIQLCSGFAENRGNSVTNETLHENCLHKPLTSNELLQRVNELLNN